MKSNYPSSTSLPDIFHGRSLGVNIDPQGKSVSLYLHSLLSQLLQQVRLFPKPRLSYLSCLISVLDSFGTKKPLNRIIFL